MEDRFEIQEKQKKKNKDSAKIGYQKVIINSKSFVWNKVEWANKKTTLSQKS